MKLNKLLLLEIGIAFIICVAVSIFFVWPAFTGKTLTQFDIKQFEGSAKEIKDYRAQGEEVLWTNSMFSGMPAYVVSTMYNGNIFTKVRLFVMNVMPAPAPLILLLMLNFFLLLIAIKSEPLLALTGAVAFAFSTYFIIIIAAGHNAKVDAIAWLPGVLAGMYVAYRRNIWIGTAVFGLFFVMELKASHPQMTYYFSFLALAFILTEFIGMLLEKRMSHFFKATALLGIMAILALGSNWSYIKTTNDYAKFSIRGTSELSSGAENKTSGLDRDYITQWSNGISETWSMLVPNFKGGESGDISKNKTAMTAVGKNRSMLQGNTYWGNQPFTGGPVYVGAGIFLLFFFSLFFFKDRMKWPLLAVSVFMLFISWGHNVPKFTNFMMDHFPLYNKFRAVASALIVPELVIPLLALAGITVLVRNRELFVEKWQIFGLKTNISNQALFLTLSGSLLFLLLLMYFFPLLFNSFFADGEYQKTVGDLLQMGASESQANQFLAVLEEGRIAIFKADVLRSFIFVTLTALVVWLYGKYGFHKYIFGIALFLITSIDLISINTRYLNKANFAVQKEKFTKTPADISILRDTDLSYRVANLSVSPFQDATTSYFHKSIGGYHGAKLKKYQELIENGISPDLEYMFSVLRRKASMGQVDTMLRELQILNMLNTKYFILNPDGLPLQNPYANGNAWFPNEIKWVNNADEEMNELLKIDTKNTAVVEKKFESDLGNLVPQRDSVSSIRLTSYHPEKLVYEAKTPTDKIAVFSEIWYPEGWYCYIDENEVPIGRANYVLRAVKVPAGQHKIELVFNPRFDKDELISMIFSVLLLLICIGLLAKELVPYMRK